MLTILHWYYTSTYKVLYSFIIILFYIYIIALVLYLHYYTLYTNIVVHYSHDYYSATRTVLY